MVAGDDRALEVRRPTQHLFACELSPEAGDRDAELEGVAQQRRREEAHRLRRVLNARRGDAHLSVKSFDSVELGAACGVADAVGHPPALSCFAAELRAHV